ncbi:sensor histidine kinase [Flavitalea sp.]|nr:histidine kinase [Flavitalea sp.]
MNPWKPTKIEFITFLLLAPVLTLLFNIMLFGDRVYSDGLILAYSFPVTFIDLFFFWYFHILVMHWYRVRLPRLNQTLLRLSLLTITHIIMSVTTFWVLFKAYDYNHFLGFTYVPGTMKSVIWMSICLTLIATTTWEAEYFLRKWKESLSEKEQFQQLAIQHEFDALKNQVNPHFLFNCFNTLSSLISEDPRRAEKFLDELSKVYRYLLRNNEDGLSTVQNELRFIESYYRLLKTRHGDAIELQLEVDKRYDPYLIPSLSLQLLVENAVKHNVVSRQQPLVIDIFAMVGNKLAVNNNSQIKGIKAPSNKVGLENIRHKFELLNQPGFQVMEDSRNFTVILPLIWNVNAEKKLSIAKNKTNPINTGPSKPKIEL